MIRKIFDLVPKGMQERIKLLFYNTKIKDFSFSKENDFYITKANEGWSILSLSPLYFIVKDVKRYEQYYNVVSGDIVIDAGANEGILTLIYSRKVNGAGSVYAFEPDNKNISTFQQNISLNQDTGNINLQKKGLWNKSDVVEFYEAGTVGSSMYYEGKDSVKKTINVTSIDEFVRQESLRKLDFIKMDIEGAEIEALAGAVETIRSLKPNFAIASYHLVNEEYTYIAVEAFFKELEYPYKTIFFEDGEIITYAGPQLQEA
ncbi:FkbM family methyltransferase [Salegentibacter sp. F188]|uniref:FkbM family methyltransferase n=1 Tax=Autumnicola patrickiae TaxID=3075591 RepID=A0ABU3DXY6_9FLAO|nr:FkbM family methyltransferase [Salegentibacter sp. F188]MDT0688586.1 FkbM family methyltransferase [Salegentibacter sp. F188]